MKTKTKPLVAARRAPAFAKKPAVVATGIALSLMVGPMAYAQQASDTVEKIEVTGSRIPPKNLDSAGSPVSVVSAEDIKMEGVRTIESLLNTLPQVVADQGANLANGASGTACINLRGLGCNRTLVLMNGKRLPPGAPNFYPADTNEIPPQLISRVEILTGGAGAVYGSDAVAGVINFIMNDKFQGVQIDYNNSFFNHHQQDTGGVGDLISAKVAAATASSFEYQRPGDVSADGKTNDISMIMGSNFADGKGNATLFFRYAHTDGILGAARDFSDCTLSSSAAGFSCSGSGTAYPGRFVVSKGNGPVPGSYTVADAAGNVRPYTSGDSFNFGSYNYFQRPDERYQFNAFAHYDLTPTMQTYSQFGFMDDHTVAQIAPAGSFGDIIFPIHYENPFLSAAWKTTLGLTGPGTTSNIEIFRRDVEGGARETDIRNTSFRGVVGLKGDINKTWSFDAFLQWGQVVNQQEIFNYFDKTKLTNALDVITGANGQPVCRSGAAGCVPYNIWSLGGVTQAALNYMYAPGMQRGNTTQTVDGGTVTGDLGDYGVRSPWAKDGVQVLGGLEYRKESLSLFTDAELTNFGLDGTGGPTLGVAGGQNFKEGFAEVTAPLIQDRPWAKLLNIEGSWRHSEISTGKSDDSYGTQVSWAPNDWGKLRGSYQRAVRAPNIIELFTPQGLNLFAMSSDPCAGAAPTATAAQCARSGVTAAQYGNILVNPTVQYNTISGGNPNLAPELADTYTGGVILTPAKNLVLSADYFNIRVQNEIGTVPGGLAVTQCVETGNPAYCGLITRDQFGSLWQLPTGHVLGTNVNIAQAKTVGWDFSGTYSYRLPSWGSLRAEFIGTALEKAVTTPLPGQPSYNCAGLAGPNCANTWSNPLPKWKHRASMDWVTPWNVNLRVQWRHIGPVDNEGTSSSPSLNNPGLAPVDAHLESRDYIDLAGSWAINKMFTVRAGVNNVFDKDPPLQGSAIAGAPFGNNNTYPQTYDALGRYCFINLTAKF